MEENLNGDQNIPYAARVHRILAHSYSFYLVAFFVAVILDLIFRIKILSGVASIPWGFAFIIFASLLIVWAQSTSRNLKKGDITYENFYHGPYCFTRSPTHWGLFLLMLGFGLVTNAFFVIISTLVSFAVTKIVFLNKEEKILAEKYGGPYLEYKKKVKF